MNKLLIKFCVISSSISILFCSLNDDAIMVGVSNAYTNLSRGYGCVGINPANLAIEPKFSINLGGFVYGLRNNIFRYNEIIEISGKNMIDSTSVNYYDKNRLKDLIGYNDFIISNEFSSIVPFLNFSIKNFAFTTKTKSFSEFGMPRLFLNLIFFGNTINEEIEFNIPYSTQTVQETAFSYGKENNDVYYGVSLKHLLGIFHSDLYPIDKSYFVTDTSSFVVEGSYLFRQGIGGNGFSLDFGVLTKEFLDGYQFGLSLINVFGYINWGNNSFFRGLTEGLVESIIPEEFQLRSGEFRYYSFSVDSLTALSLSTDSPGDLVSTINYPVIKVNQIEDVDLFLYNSDLVVDLPDSSGYLVPSGDMPDSFIEKHTMNRGFVTPYPTLFRIGLSRRLMDDTIFEIDLVTSFNNSMGYSHKWQFNFGSEITRFKSYPIRFGFSLDHIGSSISFGSGFHKRKFNYDYAFALYGIRLSYNDLSLANSRGIKFSMNLSWQ